MLRSMPPDKMYLHQASYYKIKNYNQMARPGGFTERAYIKACSPTVEILRSWVRANGRPDGSFTNQCPVLASQRKGRRQTCLFGVSILCPDCMTTYGYGLSTDVTIFKFAR